MNIYIVWTEALCEDGWRPDYYLFIAAKSHSGAKFEYARFGDWEYEYFSKQPDGFAMHCHLIEKDAPYESAGEIWGYEETAGVDLIMSGVLQPMWRVDEVGAEGEFNYRQWDGFRKPSEMEREP